MQSNEVTINNLPRISTIDPIQDLLPIYTNSTEATQSINRNSYLQITGNPVGDIDTQTLSNKTLSSPILSGTVGGTYTLGGTPTFPSSVVTTTGTQTLSNKTITNPTLTVDTITGYTNADDGTLYGIGITNSAFTTNNIMPVSGIINSSSVVNPTGAVTQYAGSTPPTGWLFCDGSAVSRTTYSSLYSTIGNVYGVGDGSTTFNLPDLRSRIPVGVGQGTFVTSFASSAVNTGTSQITITANTSFYNGTAVKLSNSGGTVPTGLANNTTYYVIIKSSTTIQLATTVANAVAGTAISLSGQGSGTNVLTITYGTYTLGQQGGEESHASTINEMPNHNHVLANKSGTSGGGYGLLDNGSADTNPQITNFTGGSQSHNNLQTFLVLNYIIKT